jgi:integrase
MLRSGVGVKVVAERVGHASTSFTQDVYAWVLPDMQQDAAKRMAAAVEPRDGVTQDLR